VNIFDNICLQNRR